jgi:hypothetical protein
MAKIEKILDNYKKEQAKRDLKDHESCLLLKEKLEFLVKNPIDSDRYIKNIDKKFYRSFIATDYYCKCDEVQAFIKETNKNGPIKIATRDKYYVSRIFVYPNIYNNTIQYGLS